MQQKFTAGSNSNEHVSKHTRTHCLHRYNRKHRPMNCQESITNYFNEMGLPFGDNWNDISKLAADMFIKFRLSLDIECHKTFINTITAQKGDNVY